MSEELQKWIIENDPGYKFLLRLAAQIDPSKPAPTSKELQEKLKEDLSATNPLWEKLRKKGAHE